MARKILLADDSVTAQNMGRKILTDAGYEVVTVNNGSAALKKIIELKPDLIVLDVYMPGYSGLEVCQRIKENKDTARTPILLTVGKLEPFKPEEARRAKADAFVVKPFEASELLAALARLEDKVVPQPEPYKQGRFAKAIAAVDQNEAAEKDESWKRRLRVPGAAKARDTQEVDGAASQGEPVHDFSQETKKKNPVAGETSPSANKFERPLPAGLPADITPEEIAAITAAAEQLKAAAAAPSPANSVAPRVEEAPSEPVTFASAPEAGDGSRNQGPDEVPGATEAQTAQPHVAASDDSRLLEAAPVSNPTAAPVDESPAAVSGSPTIAPEATPEAPAPVETDADDEVMAALQSLMPAVENNVPSLGGSANDRNSSHDRSVAMSEVAGELDAAHLMAHTAGPRWIAEEVALAPDEQTLSLAREMEQAYAAVGAGDGLRAAVAVDAVTPGAVAGLEPPATDRSAAAGESTPAPAAYAMAAAAGDLAVASVPTMPTRELENSADGANTAPASPEISAERDLPSPNQSSASVAESVVEAPDAPAYADIASAEGEQDMVANWKNIRDSIATGAAKPAPAMEREEVRAAEPQSSEPEPPASNAPAVRAQSASDPKAIASIVDSVLAELRPRIVEEIAKKLADTKKD